MNNIDKDFDWGCQQTVYKQCLYPLGFKLDEPKTEPVSRWTMIRFFHIRWYLRGLLAAICYRQDS